MYTSIFDNRWGVFAMLRNRWIQQYEMYVLLTCPDYTK